jgi:hypothetical protein
LVVIGRISSNLVAIGRNWSQLVPGLAPIYWTRIFDDYSRGPLLSNSTGDR